MPTDAPDTTIDIKVSTPLPSNVVMTLGALIDAAWPDSQLAFNEDRFTNQVIYRINNASRRAVPDEEAAALHVEPATDGIDIIGLGPEGVSMLTPSQVAANLLPVIKTAFEEFPDAENYLEMPIIDPETHHRYVLTFARSKEQTPHALRMVAEAALVTARDETRNEAHRTYAAALWGLKLKDRAGRPDTYEAGVTAALDAVRQLSPRNYLLENDDEEDSAGE
ncbi:MAG TPA: hypothetical protein VF867_15340 [Arthrobacter sp.]